MASASGHRLALGVAALARALVADGHVADELYRAAIELPVPHPHGDFLARARLCYGEWLRRNDRRVEAGTQLRAAFDGAPAMGANAFAERARRELEATGEKVRRHRERHRRRAHPSRTPDRPARAGHGGPTPRSAPNCS